MTGRYDITFKAEIKDETSLANLRERFAELNSGRHPIRKFFVGVIMRPLRAVVAFILESMPRYVVRFQLHPGGKTYTSNMSPTWNPINARNRAGSYEVESRGSMRAWVERIR